MIMDFIKAITQTPKGVIIKLHITPGSKQVCFPAGYNEWRHCIEVKLVSEPKDNQANQELLSIITSFFSLSPKDVSLISGEKNREKIISLKNISKEKIVTKLKEAFDEI
jgi:uncharacterized protein